MVMTIMSYKIKELLDEQVATLIITGFTDTLKKIVGQLPH